MPVKLGSKLPTEQPEARIEIVPLIDIMFFLLAAFMLVSLSMVHLKGVKVNLPTSTTATPEAKRDLLAISVTKEGVIFLDARAIGKNELSAQLATVRQERPDTRVFIRGDRECRHGDVLAVLDLVRGAGIQNVAFETRDAETGQP
jgi:biopolymer transport protein ExbD